MPIMCYLHVFCNDVQSLHLSSHFYLGVWKLPIVHHSEEFSKDVTEEPFEGGSVLCRHLAVHFSGKQGLVPM